jgi:polyphenol oxidase
MTDTQRRSDGGFGLERLANGWLVGRFAALETVGVVHLVTTRDGPDVQQVRHDPAVAGQRIARALGLDDAAYLEQVHGGDVLACEQGGCAGHADGLVTSARGLALMGKSGDCPIVLIADRQRRAVGFAHASWRATVAGIVPKVVRRMVDSGCSADELIGCIAPSAGPCCYEVGEEVRRAAIEGIGPHAADFFRRCQAVETQDVASLQEGQSSCSTATGIPAKYHFDLWQANTDAMIRAGVRPESIHTAGVCTICRNDLFASHRREGASAGRFAAVIGLPDAGR